MAQSRLNLAFFVLVGFLGCSNDNPVARPTEIIGLPHRFHLSGTAEGTDGHGRQATCGLDLIFEIQNGSPPTSDLITYQGIHGGEVFRRILEKKGTGFEFSAIVGGNVEFRLFKFTGIVQLDIPVNETARGRFWRRLARLEGTVDALGNGIGNWVCAPLDINQPGYKDTSLVIQGTWHFESTN